MSALVVKDLNCFYENDQVLNSLDLKLEKNTIICLLGESGCGKTTLLKAVAGLQKELNGSISINGKLVDDKKFNDQILHIVPEERRVGFIFQDHALFPHLNVFDNISFSLNKLPKKEKRIIVDDVLALVQLKGFNERYPDQLSGGEQQRIAIARALVYKPDLMLLDEPFSNLDLHVRFHLIKKIRSLLKERAMSALFVTHSKEEAFAFADLIALMQDGKILQIDTAQNLYNHPNSPYVADFLGKSNYLEIEVIDDHSYQSPLGLLINEGHIDNPKGSIHTLLLRPEQISITHNNKAEANIVGLDFLGGFELITVELMGKKYIIKADNRESKSIRFNLGDRVLLKILPHNFVIFNERN